MTAYLNAFGSYLPERVLGNGELARRLGCSSDWIESVSGIQERRWAAPETSMVDLAEAAARDCLNRAGLSAAEVGLLILASGSGAPGFPGPSAELAHRLGLSLAPALDLPVASAGSIFGLVLASQVAPVYGNVLVVAAEKMSALLEAHPLDQNTAILFGDGAGAALVSSREQGQRVAATSLHSDGQFRADLTYNWSGPLKMNGLTIILQASRKLPSVISETLAAEGLSPGDVACFLLHQANQNLLVRVAKALGVPMERVFSNVARYGNTSSASLLIAAAEKWRSESPTGATVYAGFGAGLHWGALLAR
jgi:3-oxoacyl-[acyl-carrier-protein] synthase-3